MNWKTKGILTSRIRYPGGTVMETVNNIEMELVVRDAVGYGFVVRGNEPVYVQTVDPNGPGAAAGLKVRQYIYSVNGKNVLRWSHKQVAEEILNSPGVIDLVVMNHFRGS